MVCTGRLGLLIVAVVLGGAASTWGQATEGQDGATETARIESAEKAKGSAAPAKGRGRDEARVNVMGLFKQANPMIWPLALCSVVTVGFALDRLIALRRGRIMPREFVNRFLERLSGGKLDRDRAAELCRANDSPVARIFGRVVHYWGHPASAIRESVAHDVAGELLDLKRNVRVLNGTATLAPLLGLLGTVVGLIESFDALGGRTSGGAGKGEALAHGISLALMTTAFGLFIAVVSVTFYYYLLNRIDVLVREIDQNATQVIDLVAGDSGRPLADRRPLGSGDHPRQGARETGPWAVGAGP
jgi:biopolymer transport protein ExbB